jgi:hypothetical protein
VPGYKRPPDGYVSMARIAVRLGVDRRVLKRLHELDELAGVRAGGVIWLERHSLAAYLWSRPRCARDDCSRRVIGDGPGCHLHRRSGRQHSEETRQRMSQTQGPLLRVVQWRCCEECSQLSRGRFCKRACSLDSLNHGPGAEDLGKQLQEGHRAYRAEVDRVKAECGLLDVDELLERLPVPRSKAAISRYIRAGLLEPERGLGFAKPQLFAEASADELASRLHGYQDGRLRRFNDSKWRGLWINARYGIRAARKAWGKSNTLLSAAKGTVVGRPPGSGSVLTRELRQLIVTRRAEGHGNREIAREIHVSEATVRRFKPAS